MALVSVMVVVVFAAEPVEADSGSVAGPGEAVLVGIVAVLAEVGPGSEAVAVLVLDTVALVPDIVAAAESDQDIVVEVVELEVDRVVAVALDPGIVTNGRQPVVPMVSVLDIVVATDVLVADDIGTRIVVGTVAGTANK